MRKLARQVVIVTGASAGIGEATARKLAAKGARIILAARRRERLETVQREIDSSAIDAAAAGSLAVATDITSAEDRQRLVKTTMERYGRIDAIVNNAGYGQPGPVELVPVEDIRRNFETNLFSLIALTQLVIPIMRNQRSGRIVNIGSVAGRIARPLSSIYDSTKHALEAISDGLRGELNPFGIQVILIQPGFIITEFLQVANEIAQPLMENAGAYAPFFAGLGQGYERVKRIAGQPNDIAHLVVKALEAERPRARYAAPRHARLALALKRLLPERWFDTILNRQLGVTAEKLRLTAAAAAAKK